MRRPRAAPRSARSPPSPRAGGTSSAAGSSSPTRRRPGGSATAWRKRYPDARGRRAGPRASGAGAAPRASRCAGRSWRARGRAAELLRPDPPHAALQPRLLEDRLGEVGPGRLPAAGDVPDPERQRDELPHRRREMPDVGRRAALVVDHRHLVPLGPGPEHRPHEVVPPFAEEPRGPDDPGPLARRRLAVELRPSVHGERVRRVRLDVRGSPCSRRKRSRWRTRRAVRRALRRAGCRRR